MYTLYSRRGLNMELIVASGQIADESILVTANTKLLNNN